MRLKIYHIYNTTRGRGLPVIAHFARKCGCLAISRVELPDKTTTAKQELFCLESLPEKLLKAITFE